MLKFHPLRLVEKRQLTDKSVELTFDIQSKSEFSDFKPGAYVNVQAPLKGELVRRSYSLSSLPNSRSISIGVKCVEGGLMSSFLTHEIHVDQTLEVSKPEGNFGLRIDDSLAIHHVFFGAGSGITPLMSMIQHVLSFRTSDSVTLFFGNRSSSEIMYKEELARLSASNPQFTYHNILSDKSLAEPILSGRIDFGKTWALLGQFVQDELHKEFYICGPGEMILSVRNALKDLGHADDHIHLEYFKAPDADGTPVLEVKASTPQNDFVGVSKVEAELDDESFEFEVPTNGNSVLDTALDEGLDPPFSCKGGVCTSCKAKIIEGTVKMDSNFALTDSELADGFILTCQSHPTSEKLKITWDF